MKRIMENSIDNMDADKEEDAVESNEIVAMHLKMNLFENKVEIIQNMIFNAYQNQLPYIDSRYYKFKELAGIVLWNKSQPADSFVVSLGAGTKCSLGENLRFDGVDLIDMHAEVLARRGLLHFLYILVMRQFKGETNFLVKCKKNLCYFHENFEFHLYITSAPCGDSRIFLVNSNSSTNLKDAHPNRKCRGVLRTKLESGAGTIPVSDKVIQSIDGIKDGKGLKVMSCSDKILKWNVLGVQGAFLSNFLKPIYLKSVIIGSMFAEDHMKRALYDRVDGLKLKWPFCVNKPKLYGFQNDTIEGNAVHHSFVYNIYFGSEIIGGDGRLVTHIQNKYSYVSRRSLFELFIQLMLLTHSEIVPNQLYQYRREKNAITNYNTNKNLFFEYLSKNGFKTWLKKPVDINLFYVKA